MMLLLLFLRLLLLLLLLPPLLPLLMLFLLPPSPLRRFLVSLFLTWIRLQSKYGEPFVQPPCIPSPSTSSVLSGCLSSRLFGRLSPLTDRLAGWQAESQTARPALAAGLVIHWQTCLPSLSPFLYWLTLTDSLAMKLAVVLARVALNLAIEELKTRKVPLLFSSSCLARLIA